MFEGINMIDFVRRFNDNDSCYSYLMENKWGNGFSCSYCGCTQSVKGRHIVAIRTLSKKRVIIILQTDFSIVKL